VIILKCKLKNKLIRRRPYEIKKLFKGRGRKLKNSLTKRELECLIAKSLGLTSKKISSLLCTTTSTVKAHLSSAYKKLKVNNDIQAIEKASVNNILNYENKIRMGIKYRLFGILDSLYGEIWRKYLN